MKSRLVLIVVVVAAVAVASIALFFTYFAFNNQGALGFGASVNATGISQNQTLRVDVSVKNGIDFSNRVPLSGDWKVQNLSMGPCASYYAYPYGIAVYQGRYALDNLSSATQVDIYYPGVIFCPTNVLTGTDTFVFNPQQNMSSYVDLRGYWTTGETPQPGGGSTQGVLHPFLPGVYTVVAGDEWGHVKVLYFQVGGISLEAFSLCVSNCGYPSPYLTGEVYIGGPAAFKSLQLTVNGTDEGVVPYGPISDVIMVYKGGFQNPPVVSGEAYSLRFVAAFEDGSTSTATTVVVAS